MKNKTLTTALMAFAAIFFIYAAMPETSPDKEDRNVGSFVGVGLGIDADLYLTQGKGFSVKIEADAKILELIETKVEGDVLKIRYTKNNVPNHGKTRVWVTMEDIESLNVSGSGLIEASGNVMADELNLRVSGSGDIVLDKLSGEEVGASISGSGGVELAGEGASEMDIAISGSGYVKAMDFVVEEVSATISGSGHCHVHVSGELDARISGSGKVYYSGNPEVDARVSGSGKVEKK